MTHRRATEGQSRTWSLIADMPLTQLRDDIAKRAIFPPRMWSHPDIYELVDALIEAEHKRREYVDQYGDTPLVQAARRRAMQTEHSNERGAAA